MDLAELSDISAARQHVFELKEEVDRLQRVIQVDKDTEISQLQSKLEIAEVCK